MIRRFDDYHSYNVDMNTVDKTPFNFFQEHSKDYRTYVDVALKGVQKPSLLSTVYFSKDNMDIIQNMLKKYVFIKSGGQYRLMVDQEEKELLVVMRTMYFQYAKNLPYKIKEQIHEINTILVEEIGPRMLTAVQQDVGYQDDISQVHVPMDRPMNVSSAGRKTLPSITNQFIF